MSRRDSEGPTESPAQGRNPASGQESADLPRKGPDPEDLAHSRPGSPCGRCDRAVTPP